MLLGLSVLNFSLFQNSGAQCDASPLVGYGESGFGREFKPLPSAPNLKKTFCEKFRVPIFLLYQYILAHFLQSCICQVGCKYNQSSINMLYSKITWGWGQGDFDNVQIETDFFWRLLLQPAPTPRQKNAYLLSMTPPPLSTKKKKFAILKKMLTTSLTQVGIFNRPGVARAVLRTASSVIDLFIN